MCVFLSVPWAQKSLLCAIGRGAAPVEQRLISEENEALGRTAVALPRSCPLGTFPLRWDGPTAPLRIRLGKVGGENFSYVVFKVFFCFVFFFLSVSPLPLYSLNLKKIYFHGHRRRMGRRLTFCPGRNVTFCSICN